MTEPDIHTLKSRFNAHSPHAAANDNVPRKEAAVLVLLMPKDQGGYDVLLTQRSAQMKEHAGEICFPGGRVDGTDKDRTATALREAWEEIGLEEKNIQVLGAFDPQTTRSGYNITPVLAVLEKTQSWQASAAEVSRVMTVPLAHVMDDKNFGTTTIHRYGRDWMTDSLEWQGNTILGATAAILKNLGCIMQPAGAPCRKR